MNNNIANVADSCAGKCKETVDSMTWAIVDVMTWAGTAFLAVSLLVAAAIAIVTLLERLRTPQQDNNVKTLDGTAVPPILQALAGLIDSLAKAPAWFAMYLAGLLLLWTGSNVLHPPEPKATPSPTPAQTPIKPLPGPTQTPTPTPSATPTPTPRSGGGG